MPKSLEIFVGRKIGLVSRLAWFGFAADPPTLAHRAVIDAVMGSGRVEKVLVFPSAKLPYKDFSATDWQRNEMTEIWAASAEFGDEVILSKFDILRDEAITWFDLWKKIQHMSSKMEHWLIVGSDQYEEIPKSWYRGAELIEDARMIVVPRVGYPLQTVAPHHLLLNIDPVAGASTEVRAGNLELLDEKVREYVIEERLYGTEE